LGLAVDGANRPDSQLLARTLDAIVVKRPRATAAKPQRLCLDAGYDNPETKRALSTRKYRDYTRRIARRRRRGEPKPQKPVDTEGRPYPHRRWVVERTLAWLSKCRGLLVRYEKKVENYLALLQLACALIWSRRFIQLGSGP
jgi:putative transposase